MDWVAFHLKLKIIHLMNYMYSDWFELFEKVSFTVIQSQTILQTKYSMLDLYESGIKYQYMCNVNRSPDSKGNVYMSC